jgi:PncC family amidohydrolase
MSPERRIIELLARTGQTLVCAESCTGGMVAARLTAVPGASAVFLGGIVAYHNDVKRDLLEVAEDIIAAHGAVSAECAVAMAAGARRLLRGDWAVAATGLAGPGGATPGKPVGLVYVAVAGPAAGDAAVERCRFAGDRAAIREQTAARALALLAGRLRPAAD